MLPEPEEVKDKVIYFVPNEFVITTSGEPTEQEIQGLIDWANSLAPPSVEISLASPVLQFPPPEGPVLELAARLPKDSFQERPAFEPPPVSRDPFALVHANVTGLGGDDITNALDLLDLIVNLDASRGDAPGVTVEVVTPNYLLTGGPKPGGTGGPGGLPVPYEGAANVSDFMIKAAPEDEWLQSIFNIPDDQRGKGVVIAILDTVPYPDEVPVFTDRWLRQGASDPVLAKIYKKWVTDRPGDPHPLISRLLNPADPRLTVYLHHNVDSPIPDTAPPEYFHVHGQNYEMSGHGFFVAGEAVSIASAADFHLFQILNRNCVGNLIAVADALQTIISQFGDGPLVVSGSFTLTFPRAWEHSKLHTKKDPIGKAILDRKTSELSVNSWFGRQAWPAEWICDLVYLLGSRMIAAAGNDYDKKRHAERPRARYPAAFESVVGVAALPKSNQDPSDTKKLKTTSYSNLADSPASKGIATLGGEQEDGVLGIFVDKEFPPTDTKPNPTANENGSCKWCGTSFATPIISGITAAVLSSMLPTDPQATTQMAINKLYEAQAIRTVANEDVLFVTQGPPPP